VNFKVFGIAGALVASALIGGTLIGAVAAAPTSREGASPLSGTLSDETGSQYCDLWMETFATHLGVEVDALTPAAKAASIAVVEALVEDGELPADVGERLIGQIEDFDGSGCRLLGAHLASGGRHAARADLRHDLFAAAAASLGMEPADLLTALHGGSSLQEVADDQGVAYKAVVDAVVTAADTDLGALVEAGRISQERADQILADLTQALNSGEWPPLWTRHARPFEGSPSRVQ